MAVIRGVPDERLQLIGRIAENRSLADVDERDYCRFRVMPWRGAAACW